MSIWEPAVNSLSGVDPLPYESVPRVQGMSAPNVFSLFRCRSSLCLWRPFSSRPFSSVWIQSHPSRGCRESCLCSFGPGQALHMCFGIDLSTRVTTNKARGTFLSELLATGVTSLGQV